MRRDGKVKMVPFAQNIKLLKTFRGHEATIVLPWEHQMVIKMVPVF